MNNKSLPVLLTNPNVLIIGGSKTALLKAQALQKNSLKINIVAPDVCDELRSIATRIDERNFTTEDLQNVDLVIDATGNNHVLQQLLGAKQDHQFLLNCCSNRQASDFYLCAQTNVGDLKISISTCGSSPTISRLVRDKIARFIPAEIEFLTDEKNADRLDGRIDVQETEQECQKAFPQVYLIGCGPGDPDLLTLKAYKLIKQVDIVLYDHLLTDEILELIPESTEKIPVGKQKGCHSYKQDDINELLYQKVLQGHTIGRLKCGDPYIFGRGSEEAEYLTQRDIRVEVVSGISSAIAGPACAGIPATARGYATHLSIVSAHLAGNHFNEEWFPLLKIQNHTTVVLMGLSFAREISIAALKSGISPTLPVAIVSNASRPDQKVIVTDLLNLPIAAENAERPAILIFGNVVNLHQILSASGQTTYRQAL